MKGLLYSMAGLLMVGTLPAVAQAGHRGGGSHWDVSIGFGQNSYNSWSNTRINFGEGRGHRDRGDWNRGDWNRGNWGRGDRYRGNWGRHSRGDWGGNYYYSTPSYRYYQPRSYCPPEVVYSPPPVVYTPPVLICRPPVIYNPPCYNYPSGTYYDVNIGFSYGR
ncbi:MAG: hypothetical protein IT447_03480 [Phycisphaerales bacterium]|nr:hypothetical protein [Phycisphaerales bacterium]